jgi:hypothetical protein
MVIKKYQTFVSEKIAVVNTDTPTVASAANTINQLDDNIKEFNTRRIELENIYKTSIDEKDLVSKLSARKFINPVNAKSSMKFFNPLFSKYSGVCDLKKQVVDLEKEQSTIETTIKDKESDIGKNPSSKDGILNDIKTKKTDIESIKTKLATIKSEADRLERLTMQELQEMQKEIVSGTKEVRQGRSLS